MKILAISVDAGQEQTATTPPDSICDYSGIVLGSEKLKDLVKCPQYKDQDEWILLNLSNFYVHINLLYGTVLEFCTDRDCGIMNAGPIFEYTWYDEISKTQIALSAPKYIQHLMSWIESKLNNINALNSHDFKILTQTIFKRLFRVYAHIYHCHFSQIIALGQEPHINTSLKHFILFSKEHDLIEEIEFRPLQDFLNALIN